MNQDALRILFLGAGKRLGLLEAFVRAARDEGEPLSIFCAEIDRFAPAGLAAKVIQAPRFESPEFSEWLIDHMQSKPFDIIVPNMDSATVALSRMSTSLLKLGAWPVVSAHALCKSMEDKRAADLWFSSNGFIVPGREAWPRIFKKRLGFGSRGQVVVHNDTERERFLSGLRDEDAYFEQTFLPGSEYSVDAYVDRSGRLIAAMPRIRLEVVHGEVNTSMSARHERIEEVTRKLFSMPGWQGPLTAQFIDTEDGPVLLEVNPRFGGGVTHAIHLGLDMPRWILREALGRGLPDEPIEWKAGSLMMRCRRDVFFDDVDSGEG